MACCNCVRCSFFYYVSIANFQFPLLELPNNYGWWISFKLAVNGEIGVEEHFLAGSDGVEAGLAREVLGREIFPSHLRIVLTGRDTRVNSSSQEGLGESPKITVASPGIPTQFNSSQALQRPSLGVAC